MAYSWNNYVCSVLIPALAVPCASAAQPDDLTDTVQVAPLSVTAGRGAGGREAVPFTVLSQTAEEMDGGASVTLDGALQRFPGFSLFRRGDSLTVNPSAQGVSLRGLGPSGASRSLVLLDGVPLSEPFGGWVNWSQVPGASLGSSEVVFGGGGTAWGNASLGGVLQLFSQPFSSDRTRLSVLAGALGTQEASFFVSRARGGATFQVSAEEFSSEGPYLTAQENRGTLDRRAWSRHQSGAVRWRQQLSPSTELTVSARGFVEHRGNGTPYQVNASRGDFLSATLHRKHGETFDWTAVAYGQEGSFSSTFSSVASGRVKETPASDQFAVPSSTAGLSWVGTQHGAAGAATRFGVDVRGTQGENRERYLYSIDHYTRERDAGGSQGDAGLFLLREQPLPAGLSIFAGLRWDRWRDAAGHRRETDLASGTVLRNDANAGLSGGEGSPGGGLAWVAAPGLRLHLSAQRAFRRPTLGELYRPFRVGNVVTEANPALRTESALSSELGADYARKGLSLRAAVFANELRDAVSNVTLARGPGTYPIFGFLQAGVTGRQRLNLDAVRVRGLDVSGTWSISREWRVEGSLLWEHTEVAEARISPDLEGKRLAQVPDYAATIGLIWLPLKDLRIAPRLRWTGSAYDDDQNTLNLAPATTLDVSVNYRLREGVELFLKGQNISDSRVEASHSVDGVYTLATPRLVTGGCRWGW